MKHDQRSVDWRKWDATWIIKCGVKEIRWNMNNEVDNITNTNQKHLPLTGTNHCNSRLLKIFTFRETITHFRTKIFSRFQFLSPILDGLCISFKVHHFFIRKQFVCVDCCTDRLTFSNIILHKTATRWIFVASQAEMRKDECVAEVVEYEWNLIVMNYWRKIL